MAAIDRGGILLQGGGARSFLLFDYAVFYENSPQNLEDISPDFNIPGFLADRQWYQEDNAITETVSHPGHLTVTQYGNNGG